MEIKENDTRRQWVARFLARVDKAMAVLDEREIKLVNYYYWEHIEVECIACELNTSKRHIYRMKECVVGKLVPFILPGWVTYPYESKKL